jgi:glycosyltransferase involved in cell wall biosynthesis
VPRRNLRILTWHVHGNYLYYLSQVPHTFCVLADAARSPGYAGRAGRLPWGDNVVESPVERLREERFDVVLFQSRSAWERDQHVLLSAEQRRLPRIYLEHDPPQEHPTNTRHFVDDPGVLLVHCTHFNRLMWDSGRTPTRVIEHGVVLPQPATYTGELARGIAVVNHLAKRGRRLGADVFLAAREHVPLDLVGMDAERAGGLGEIGQLELAAFVSRYRFYFHPVRWTSLGLALIEAMMVGLPVVGLATTELAGVIRNGVNGFIDTSPERLVADMRRLLADPALAREAGAAGRREAEQRFAIGRFVADWLDLFAGVTG